MLARKDPQQPRHKCLAKLSLGGGERKDPDFDIRKRKNHNTPRLHPLNGINKCINNKAKRANTT